MESSQSGSQAEADRQKKTRRLASGNRRTERGHRQVNRSQQKRSEISAENGSEIGGTEDQRRQRNRKGQQKRGGKQNQSRQEFPDHQFEEIRRE